MLRSISLIAAVVVGVCAVHASSDAEPWFRAKGVKDSLRATYRGIRFANDSEVENFAGILGKAMKEAATAEARAAKSELRRGRRRERPRAPRLVRRFR